MHYNKTWVRDVRCGSKAPDSRGSARVRLSPIADMPTPTESGREVPRAEVTGSALAGVNHLGEISEPSLTSKPTRTMLIGISTV